MKAQDQQILICQHCRKTFYVFQMAAGLSLCKGCAAEIPA